MNWEAVGAIGEIVGSLAVVITIAYLAVQIRQSGQSAKSVSSHQSRSAVTDVIGAVSENTDAVKTYTEGMVKRDELELHERVRFDLIIFQMMRSLETIFLEYREGLVPEEVWQDRLRPKAVIQPHSTGRVLRRYHQSFEYSEPRRPC